MVYGIGYMGSKSRVIEKIAQHLPQNYENFYDLFGGGFAVSHYMAVSQRYKNIYYNEIKSTVVQLVKDAIDGKYNANTFTPDWVSREMFHERKDACAYTRILWSFVNNQRTYLYGKHLEERKKSIHNAIVFNQFDETAKKILGIESFSKKLSINFRRLKTRELVRKTSNLLFLQSQHLERLARLEGLEGLEGLQNTNQLDLFDEKSNLFFSSKSYDEIEIKKNSIIYCDPPYQNTEGYLKKFDHGKFWDWVRQNKNPVFVSEYSAPSDIKLVTSFESIKTIGPTGGATASTENIYWNGVT